MRTLRLCFIGPTASVTTRRWVEWFVGRGHQATAITVEPAGADLAPGFREVNVRVSLGPRKLGRLASAARMAFMLRRLRPDIVHVHYVRGLAWGLLLNRFHPCVVTPWGSDVLEEQGAFKEWYGKTLTRAVLNMADLVTVHSGYLETRIRPLLPSGCKVIRIGWGVDLRRFRPHLDTGTLRQRWGIDAARRVIFSPRLAQPFYRHECIISALPGVRRRFPETLLVIAEQSADPEYTQALHRLASESGVRDHVKFVGAIPYQDMPLWLNLAEIVVMIPQSDGMPNTLLEAMACGAVPVLSRLPQYAELIQDGTNGWLVEPDPDRLAETLRAALADPTARNRMARMNRALVEEAGDQEREMSRMESVYAELVST